MDVTVDHSGMSEWANRGTTDYADIADAFTGELLSKTSVTSALSVVKNSVARIAVVTVESCPDHSMPRDFQAKA